MGLAVVGTPLDWEETQKHADYIREHGITQFLNIWRKQQNRKDYPFLWGDEIESMVISYDEENRDARLSLRQSEILPKIQACESRLREMFPSNAGSVPEFQPECNRYMLESAPGSPYNGSVDSLLSVEKDMRNRRKLAKAYLLPSESLVTLTSFPRLGVREPFTHHPETDPVHAATSESLFLSGDITSPNARFPSLIANMKSRRGAKVAANIPIYFDTNTPRPFVDPTIPWETGISPEDHGAIKQDHIYLDTTTFGAGCCCLQVTLQARDVDEARVVYDALVPVTPIMMALTASSPAYRGYLADVDCRWDILEESCDDRTEEEKGLKPLKEGQHRIPKSRWSSVDMYLSENAENRPEYNDIPIPFHEGVYRRLRDNNVDDLLAKLLAHLFVRDPLLVLPEKLEQDDETSTEHFESFQSTNWQSLRLKPPSQTGECGWRIEFRTMEVQPTDFENAAMALFVVLLSRAILSFGLNLYLPISKVDENMKRAQRRDAVRGERFWFRKRVGTITRNSSNGDSNGREHVIGNGLQGVAEDECEEMTINEIINGKGSYLGLFGIVDAYIESLDVDATRKLKLRKYIELVRRRAEGSLQTPATWMRNFVRSHPAYKHDSVVSREVNYDLMKAIDEIERGERHAPELLPSGYVGSKYDEPDQ
ncbi:Glutamate-cysteine ligase, partial [Rhizoctonia solani]